jgi:Xaa-Pro aminopeptidase
MNKSTINLIKIGKYLDVSKKVSFVNIARIFSSSRLSSSSPSSSSSSSSSKSSSNSKGSRSPQTASSTTLKSKPNNAIKVCRTEPDELGQPAYWTHPHLFDAIVATTNADSGSDASDLLKQVTPGITKQEYEERRHNYVNHLLHYQMVYFSSKLSKTEKANVEELRKVDKNMTWARNFIAVIPSCVNTFMALDVQNLFKQNSDFLYLTGFKEPNAVLVLSRTDANESTSSYNAALFCRDRDPKVEMWEGPSTGPALVPKLCGIQNAYALNELRNYLKALLRETGSNSRITLWRYPTEQLLKNESGPNCHIESVESDLDKFAEEAGEKLIVMNEQEELNSSAAASYYNTSRYFAQLCRVKKSAAELSIMKRACDISAEAFVNVMAVSHPYISEHLVYAKFDMDCRIRGAEHLAYIPVIAGGQRATTLHYIRNNQIIRHDSMVLMDAGCQYRDYSSDITRTWPVSGKYRGAQRELYEACLNVQKHCISRCEPGKSF